eukprot:CAMPEP_0194037560 /NCGR_PEP_ID=MMETSP0009_2-20130614/9898_1 /TAXON_ID=210454 /ORGANISM="Grammatophora oceanica, Strain CCMP 410" /LENGTH=377 /DNA_ID=CAMNT_0038679771 /DNA_START=59 /DNA_END=1192 /DNA_ORIENTATION=+
MASTTAEAGEDDNKKDTTTTNSKKRPAETDEPVDDTTTTTATTPSEETTKATPAPVITASRASKRERKSVDRMIPTNFVERTANVSMIDGRGQALKDIPIFVQHLDSLNVNAPEITEAFRFLFHRGKVNQLTKKEALLNFTGYLERIKEEEENEKDDKSDDKEKKEGAKDDADEDANNKKKKKKKQDKLDEDAEAKMSKKAYKMKIAELKKLCDFFQVDRSAKDGESVTKDVLVDRLLDFLGEPDESHCIKPKGSSSKTSSKKAAASKKSKAKSKKSSSSGKGKKNSKKEEEEEEDEEEEEEEAVAASGDEEDDGDDNDGKKLPSDKALRKWVKAYVACFNLDKATTKHAMETASDKFGVNLSEKKRVIKKMLTEEM